jgi:hypothetical protein
MAQYITPARMSPGAVPATQSIQYATGQTFGKGAVLALTSGEVVVATAPITGATIFGVSLEAVASKPGYDAANSPTVVTGRVQEVDVVRADAITVFSSELVNGSDVRIAPTQARIGVDYGFRIDANGIWVVDVSLTAGNASVRITDIDIDKGLVFWTFLAARIIP